MAVSISTRSQAPSADVAPGTRPLLSVVVPVYNGGEAIVENIGVIRRAVSEALPPEDIELVVVSDGSLDDTAERLLEARTDLAMRVIHYDRNLGKGYAVKAGALAARGAWIGLVDADLDLDPRAIPNYLDVARREGLDIAIGSKRHPDSVVHYPRSRQIASWCYQQLNRILFRLDVRDTQVGLKVFRREVADEVLPLLLVKQFAFDLELLAVASALGFTRIREFPIKLDYRFTGSGVTSRAVVKALLDTAAIFYRLRILRTYQRKRDMLGLDHASRGDRQTPRVSLVGSDGRTAERLDYPDVELIEPESLEAAAGELVAVLPERARPAGNWLSASVPFFTRPEVAAVVVPTMAPLHGPLRQRAAAAVLESRLGAGPHRIRFSPGNLRTVVEYPAEGIVVRRADYLEALAEGIEPDRLVSWLSGRGRRVVYTPEAMMVIPPAPVFKEHLDFVRRYGGSRGAAARLMHGTDLGFLRIATLLLFGLGLLAIPLLVLVPALRSVGLVFLLVYAASLLLAAARGAIRFRSAGVGLLALPALVATHVVFSVGFANGVIRGR